MAEMKAMDLSGSWAITLPDGSAYEGTLPGSLDENGIGAPDRVAKPWHPDVEERNQALTASMEGRSVITTRFTRKHVYEGAASFTQTMPEDLVLPEKERLFLTVERARALTLTIDGVPVPKRSGSLSTPYWFEVTGRLRPGSVVVFTSDNSYPGLPYRDITFSSAATDETQTNWNGLLGAITLTSRPRIHLAGLRVYPAGDGIDIQAEISAPQDHGHTGDPHAVPPREDPPEGGALSEMLKLRLTGACLAEPYTAEVRRSGALTFRSLPLSEEARSKRWDEGEGRLLSLKAELWDGETMLDACTVSFGLRTFGRDDTGRLTLNGRRIFLRGEANCAVFPETGHPPMDVPSWRSILETYASYGVNCVRFHSWCPPEAAFIAADEMGILVQPELSNWNPRDAFAGKEARCYYEAELREILRTYANHPSFVMLTLGNELHADEGGIGVMHALLALAGRLDPTRLYAWGSNNFYGEKGPDQESDFYTSTNCGHHRLRACGNKGPINTEYAHAARTYDQACAAIRKTGYSGAIFGFEVGQYEVLPDLTELSMFRGVTRPDNLALIRTRLREAGVSEKEWARRVAASGELSLIGYREEVEATLRTADMSGLSLLGLQDFPGQGTALVGMLNSHLAPKAHPFAAPKRFRAFFRDQLPLALLSRYTWTFGDVLTANVLVANYGKEDLAGRVRWTLTGTPGGEGERMTACVGTLARAGHLEIPLRFADASRPLRLDLTLDICGITNTYPIWVYPAQAPRRPPSVYETAHFDAAARDVLNRGGIVYLAPPSTKEALPRSIQAQFTTDFWSVGTFPQQEGAMGQLIDETHPLFEDFPTEAHTNWQWWPMASQRAFVLPEYLPCIVAEMDSYATLRPMAQLFEGRCGNGRILISSMGLQDLRQYPEARALQRSIYRYLSSEAFAPEQKIDADTLAELVP